MFMRLPAISQLLCLPMSYCGDSPHFHPHSPQFHPQFFGSFFMPNSSQNPPQRAAGIQEAQSPTADGLEPQRGTGAAGWPLLAQVVNARRGGWTLPSNFRSIHAATPARPRFVLPILESALSPCPLCSVIGKIQSTEAWSATNGDSPKVFTPSGSFLVALALWVAAVCTLLALLTA